MLRKPRARSYQRSLIKRAFRFAQTRTWLSIHAEVDFSNWYKTFRLLFLVFVFCLRARFTYYGRHVSHSSCHPSFIFCRKMVSWGHSRQFLFEDMFSISHSSLNMSLAYRVITQIWKRTLVCPGKVADVVRGSLLHRYSTW